MPHRVKRLAEQAASGLTGKIKRRNKTMINWKEAFTKAGIFGAVAFFSVLVEAGVDVIFTSPVKVLVSAGIVFGLTFFVTLKNIEEDVTPTP